MGLDCRPHHHSPIRPRRLPPPVQATPRAAAELLDPLAGYSRMLFSPAFLDSAWIKRMMRKAHGMRVPRKMARYAGKVTVMPSASSSDDGRGTDASGSSDAVLWVIALRSTRESGCQREGGGMTHTARRQKTSGGSLASTPKTAGVVSPRSGMECQGPPPGGGHVSRAWSTHAPQTTERLPEQHKTKKLVACEGKRTASHGRDGHGRPPAPWRP